MNASARGILACTVLCGALVFGIGSATAQIPDEFTNLQILPKDISKRELTRIMRDYAGALGQRCNFCHVGEDPNSLQGYDFASDAPDHKKVARVMMQMVDEINDRLLPSMGKEPEHAVSCVTCHRGTKEPATMQQVLQDAIDEGGVTAAKARYAELREAYYGKGSYDFSGDPLIDVAETLARQGNDVEDAIAIMEMNVELNPDEARVHLMLGRLYLRSGNKEAAIASVERALEIEPDNKRAQQLLERLKSN